MREIFCLNNWNCRAVAWSDTQNAPQCVVLSAEQCWIITVVLCIYQTFSIVVPQFCSVKQTQFLLVKSQYEVSFLLVKKVCFHQFPPAYLSAVTSKIRAWEISSLLINLFRNTVFFIFHYSFMAGISIYIHSTIIFQSLLLHLHLIMNSQEKLWKIAGRSLKAELSSAVRFPYSEKAFRRYVKEHGKGLSQRREDDK